MVGVIFCVGLGGLRGVVVRMMIVPRRQMRVMASLEMVSCFVVLGGFLVMSRRMLVVFGCFVVVLGGNFRHNVSPVPFSRHGRARAAREQ